jgi:hypothetical protein
MPTATDVSLIPGVNHGNGKVIVSFGAATSTTLTVSPNPAFQGVSVVLIASTLTKGAHTLSAGFIPTNQTVFGPSASPPALLTVKPLFSVQ